MQTRVRRDIYRKAFNLYLRKGIPIERTLQELLKKEEYPLTTPQFSHIVQRGGGIGITERKNRSPLVKKEVRDRSFF
ncbi:MAG: hypothetical protein EAY65_02990 [Alphaproteobacteria bacterium]|nr:MAG: hypothetical protein EAY65_02990 [Alphaproteobacteria bacterium]